MYLRRFHEKALDCCDPVDKVVLVNFCLHNMMEEYRIFLENLSFRSLLNLWGQPIAQMSQMHRTSRASATVRPVILLWSGQR